MLQMESSYNQKSEGEFGEVHSNVEDFEESEDDFDDCMYDSDESILPFEEEPVHTVFQKPLDTTQSVTATARLLKELRFLMNTTSEETKGFSVEPLNDDLFKWEVRLSDFEPSSLIAQELERYGAAHGVQPAIVMHFSFSQAFPFEAPFVRVIRPVLTGGFILNGGALCMEILTSQGWSAVLSLEGVIHHIRAIMLSGDVRVAPAQNAEVYTEKKALETFAYLDRYHKEHGWSTAGNS
eukprot:GCRY01004174.1.p1 GENE.GCRY01004174.1~~GCRY01004174.1.p1  ORF type:complete len:238 (+),score=30.02 GCRY01004174.1:197-910(+)